MQDFLKELSLKMGSTEGARDEGEETMGSWTTLGALAYRNRVKEIVESRLRALKGPGSKRKRRDDDKQ